MHRSLLICLGLAIGLLPASLIFSRGASAQSEALVCYYDSNGAQHDADSCNIAFDLSDPASVNLRPRCRSSAGAVCYVGNSGPCQPGARKYSQYRVLDRSADRCPPSFREAGMGGNPQTVAPTCPSGYVFSGGQCVRDAAPSPTCPSGFSLSGGNCVRDAAPAPAAPTAGQFDIRHGYDLPGGDYDQLRGLAGYEDCLSACQRDDRCHGFTFNTQYSRCFLKWRGENWTPYRNAVSGLRVKQEQAPTPQNSASQCDTGCMSAYDRCAEQVSRRSGADETHYEACSIQLESCRGGCISQGHCVTRNGGVLCP